MCCNSFDKINNLNNLKIICFLSLLFLSAHAADDSLLFSEQETVNHLVKQWSPLVWLAPKEKFMPGNVNEFLQHVHAEKTKQNSNNEFPNKYYYDTESDELALFQEYNNQLERRNKRNFKERNFIVDYVIDLPIGDESQKYFLVSNNGVDNLLENLSSFVYGENPNNGNVPIYAMVSMCSSKFKQQNNIPEDNFINDINEMEPIEYKKNPYIPLTKPDFEYNYPENTQTKIQTPELLLNNRRKRQAEESKKQSTEIQSDNTEWEPVILESPEKKKSDFIDSYENIPKYLMKDKVVPEFHVTYWMFYPYSQGKTMCTLKLGPLGHLPIPMIFGMCLGKKKDFGSHIGDWEHMTLYFKGRMEPDEMYVSAHDAGAYYSYDRLTGSFEFRSQETRKGILQRPNFPRTVVTSTNHPVLFAAQGSHGLWTAPGKHRFVRVPRLYDVNGFGTPWYSWKNIEIIYDNNSIERSQSPAWIQYKGRWGNPKSKCHPLKRIGLHFCEYSDGPTGIPLKESHFQCRK